MQWKCNLPSYRIPRNYDRPPNNSSNHPTNRPTDRPTKQTTNRPTIHTSDKLHISDAYLVLHAELDEGDGDECGGSAKSSHAVNPHTRVRVV